MKYTSFLLSCLCVSSLVMPQSVSALSCVDPATILEQYVDSSEYVIFTAIAGDTIEHVKQPASTDGNPNRQFAEGYTGQYVEVIEAHKGKIDGGVWVYHQKNSTWGYMCASGPAEAGTEQVFIIAPGYGTFDLVQVVNSYPTDSEFGSDLVTALSEAPDNGPAYVNFVNDSNWRQDLSSQIKEMMFLIRIKFAEWRFWAVQ